MRERKERGTVGRGRKRDGSLLGGPSHHLMTVVLLNPAAGFWCPYKLSFFFPTTTMASGGHRRCLPCHVMALQMWWGNFFNSQGKKQMRQIQREGHNTVLVSFSQLLYLTAAIKSLFEKPEKKKKLNASDFLRDVSVCRSLCTTSNASCICMQVFKSDL